MSSSSSDTLPVYFLHAVLKNIPVDSEAWHRLLDESRISPDVLEDHEGRTRVSLEQYCRLQAKAMILLQDELLGYGKIPLPDGSWQMMCYACISAETLNDVIARFGKFYNLWDWGQRIQTRQDTNACTYMLVNQGKAHSDPYLYELCLFNTHRFFSWMIERRLPLTRVNVTYPSPPHSAVYRMLFPHTPVFFDQPYTGFEFQSKFLSLPVCQNNVSLRKFLRHPLYELVTAEYDPQDWSTRIRRLIGKNITDVPPFELLADRLDIHPQTLRRRLRDEGTTYREIKNIIRRDTAIYYLAKPGLTVEDVSERAGFAETSSFIRAFKNWTGLTPVTYRKQTADRA